MAKIIAQYEKVIVKEHSGGYREYRIPGIIALKNALLLTFEARSGEGEENLGDWGDIDVIVLRLEEGMEPVEVFRYGESTLPKTGELRTYNNPTLIPDGDKTHLIFHKNYDNVYIVTSEDEGRSWSEPREITQYYKKFPYQWTVSATGPGHGLQMKNGRLVAPIWLANGALYEDGSNRRKHGPNMAGCIYSDDHGETWQPGEMIKIIGANETCVAELEDGRLLINSRWRRDLGGRLLTLSSDGARTTEGTVFCEKLNDPGCFGGSASCTGGVLFTNCDSKEKRINVSVKYSTDAGVNWEKIWEVDPVGGYTDIAVSGEDVYVFYERYIYGSQVKELVLQKGKLVL